MVDLKQHRNSRNQVEILYEMIHINMFVGNVYSSVLVNLNFLLRASTLQNTGDKERNLAMCYKTLDELANGGIHDHIGFVSIM